MKLLSALIALALAGVLLLQWQDWPPARPAAPARSADVGTAPASAPEDRPAVPLPTPPREDYASVVERPLFLPDRRPPPEEPEEALDDMSPEDFSDLAGADLSAVVITPDAVKAWITPYSAERRWLRIGDEIEGWTVTHIRPDSLVLERQGERNELILRDYANAPVPIPPTPLRSRLRRPESSQGAPDRRGGDPRAGSQPPRPASAETPGRGGTERAPPGVRQPPVPPAARQPPRTDATPPARSSRDAP